MKITILGNGYVGSNLYKQLVKNHETLVFPRKILDYHNKSNLDKHLQSFRPDVVFGCFGFTGRPNIDEAESKKEECWNLNVSVPLMVNTLCANRNISYVHVSTGCLFNGYDKVWNESDTPNFGMFNEPSFYTKTKHAYELSSKHLPNSNLRIRLPFNSESTQRNLICKLVNYDNILNYRNSKTCMDDLCSAIEQMLVSGILVDECGVYHMINPNPLNTEEFIAEMQKFGFANPNWKLKTLEQLSLSAPRANICLETIQKENPMMHCRPELDALRHSLKKMSGGAF